MTTMTLTIKKEVTKMKPIHAFLAVLVVFVLARNVINESRAESLELFTDDEPRSEMNSVWKSDGSLVNIYGAEESGIVVKDGEVEYYVVPKDDGSPTFIYDNELIICTNTGCY